MSQRIELRIKVGNFNTKQRSQLPQMQQTREFYVNRADNNIAANILTMHSRVMVKRGRYLHPVISALRLRSAVCLEVSPSSFYRQDKFAFYRSMSVNTRLSTQTLRHCIVQCKTSSSTQVIWSLRPSLRLG